MSTEWVLIEISEPANPADPYRPTSIGEMKLHIVPRRGEYLIVQPEQEKETVTFEVVAVRHAAGPIGDLYLRRIGQFGEFNAALRSRLKQP